MSIGSIRREIIEDLKWWQRHARTHIHTHELTRARAHTHTHTRMLVEDPEKVR
jgi:hypothetical protein